MKLSQRLEDFALGKFKEEMIPREQKYIEAVKYLRKQISHYRDVAKRYPEGTKYYRLWYFVVTSYYDAIVNLEYWAEMYSNEENY